MAAMLPANFRAMAMKPHFRVAVLRPGLPEVSGCRLPRQVVRSKAQDEVRVELLLVQSHLILPDFLVIVEFFVQTL